MQINIELNKISLASLIQLVGMSGLTGKITLYADKASKEALIALDKGIIVHAECDLKQGQAALNEILLKRSGTASFVEDDLIGMPRSLLGKAANINLPDWVLARLRQDNPNISQAITDLVIWADRLKCWIYQADADLENVLACLQESHKE
jgi:Domain of unknown function (DUF4388)